MFLGTHLSEHNFARTAKLAGTETGCRMPAVRSHCYTCVPKEHLGELCMRRKKYTGCTERRRKGLYEDCTGLSISEKKGDT